VAGIGGGIARTAFFFTGVNRLLTFAWHGRRIMPTVAHLSGRIRIMLHRNDHDPPHFHAERAGEEVQITIADLSVLRGSLRRADMLQVRQWARAHQAELALNWLLVRAELPMRDIPYP
jgi:hypothetical protein